MNECVVLLTINDYTEIILVAFLHCVFWHVHTLITFMVSIMASSVVDGL